MKFTLALSKLYPPRLWVLALLAMVAFIATDSVVHLRTTWDLVGRHSIAPPARDADSPSGYADNQHQLVLPYPGIDTYHWVLQTQSMLAGAGARIRTVDYDNAPDGREVHWSSLIRWWLAGLAWVDHAYTATPLPLAVEDVAPFGSVLLVVLIIVLVTPMIARRFGSGPAALFAFGAAGVGPFYESFTVGRTDHHGLTALADLLTVLFLLGGAAGWVRTDTAGKTEDSLPADWLPDRRQARKWFIASGVVGGIGLWVSAASVVFTLAFTGLGALLATGLLARGVTASDKAKPDPTLWRIWGWSGAATSIFCYLLEYFPSHLGMRLEVNHPLYAFAWAGGGEIIFRLCRWWGGGKLAEKARDWIWLTGSAFAVAIGPALIFLYADKVFWIRDHFLWVLHNDYIEEFFSLGVFLKGQDSFMVFIIMGSPLVLVAIPMAVWTWPGLRKPLRWGLLLGLPIGVVILVLLPEAQLAHHYWLALETAAGSLVLLIGLWSPWPEFPRPVRALLVLPLPSALIMFGLAAVEVRWIEISYALWLAALVAAAAALRLHRGYRWGPLRIIAASLFLAGTLLPNPAFTLLTWVRGNWKGDVTPVEQLELITRDVAQTLRAHEGGAPVVIVSGPTSSTWLLYWGGFKSLGTYYWENLPGMKDNADIYGARTPEEALRLLQAHHATHLVILSWVDNPNEYARLSHNLRKDQPVPNDAFVENLIHHGNMPTWLRPIYYPLPSGDYFKSLAVFIFEIDPQQSLPVALDRLAEWELQLGNQGAAIHALNSSLEADPNCLPTIITDARLDYAVGQKDVFAACIERLRLLLPEADSLEFDERLDLATVFELANDDAVARAQMTICLRTATLANLRTLRPDALYNFILLSRQLGLLDSRPSLWAAGNPLLPAGFRVQLLVRFAEQDKSAHHLPEAISLLHQALAIDPDSTVALYNLAWILATSMDDSVRQPAEALALANHAHELDRGQHVDITDALACAYAANHAFNEAVELERQAVTLAEQAKATELAGILRLRLSLFMQNTPYHE